MVIEIFGNNHIEHGHSQGGIGAGAEAQMNIRPAGQPVDPGIDHDQAGAPLHQIDHRMPEEAVAVGFQRRLAPENQNLRHLIFRIIIAPGQAAGIIDLRISYAQHIGRSGQARNIAGITGLGVGVVGSAQHHGTIRIESTALPSGAGKENNAFTTILGGDLTVVLFNNVDGLIPGTAFPFIRLTPVLAFPLHGVGDPAFVVNIVFQADTADAKASLGDRVVFIPLHPDELVVLGVEFKPAAHRMAARRGPDGGPGDGQPVLLIAPRFTKVVNCGKGIQFYRAHDSCTS
ncbi:hypothetical protein HMPREF0322_00700 [Desulfitobacterium hafniense DP7]|uniref:Uncharacterized protein n=1 Tax=Desulfitobacterium hafniense DP7 TaxID=537010 RepID=G9XIC5_DESHA|nr:hypothetical protein HMPREF0322_00700 [Desulfitobacterium hafniense DP7]